MITETKQINTPNGLINISDIDWKDLTVTQSMRIENVPFEGIIPKGKNKVIRYYDCNIIYRITPLEYIKDKPCPEPTDGVEGKDYIILFQFTESNINNSNLRILTWLFENHDDMFKFIFQNVYNSIISDIPNNPNNINNQN